MSDNENTQDEDGDLAYSVTRKLFWWTAGGTIAFSGLMIAAWYL